MVEPIELLAKEIHYDLVPDEARACDNHIVETRGTIAASCN